MDLRMMTTGVLAAGLALGLSACSTYTREGPEVETGERYIREESVQVEDPGNAPERGVDSDIAPAYPRDTHFTGENRGVGYEDGH